MGAERPATTLPVVIMRSLRPFIMLPSILYATQVSLALHIEFPRGSGTRLSNLLTRAPNATSTLDKNYGGYNINITLGGKQFSVMVDTGRYALYPYRLISAPNISPHSYWYKTLVQTFGYRGRYPMPSIRELLLKSITTSAQLKVSVFCFFSESCDRDLTHVVLHASPFQGPVKKANLTMLGFTVPNQAFSTLLCFSSRLVLIVLASQSR